MKFFTISRLFLFSMLIGGVLIFSIVYAAVNNNQLFPNGVSGYVQSKDNGWVTPASTSKDITIWDGSCRRISSTSNTLAFIPTRTQAEWGSFSAHLPSGVSVGSCGVNGLCNNTTNFACSSGTSVNNISGSCGGNATWQCQGINGGSTVNCSKANVGCLLCDWQYHPVVGPLWPLDIDLYETPCTSSLNGVSAYEIKGNKQKVATCSCQLY